MINALEVTKKALSERIELLFRDAAVLRDELRHVEEWGDSIYHMMSTSYGQNSIIAFKKEKESPMIHLNG